MKHYLFDYDIDESRLINDSKTIFPNTFKRLCGRIELKNKVLSYNQKNFGRLISDSLSEIEWDLNEIYFTEDDLGVTRMTIKKLLQAYCDSGTYLSQVLEKKFPKHRCYIFINFFISKEISHDIRFWINRNDNFWISKPKDIHRHSTGSMLIATVI